MKFSVLISIYYKENSQYFSDAIESIWDSQSIKPSEIVLVKDGTLTSELDSVIANWKAKLKDVLVVIPLEKNVGLGNALNEGLKHCSNDWVFRMDTDDICVFDRFEKQLEFIEKNPDIVLLGGQIEEFKTTPDNITGIRSVPTDSQGIYNFSQKRSPFNHPTVAYRKSIIAKLGAYQHHLLMEDYNLWIRVIANGYKVANLLDTLLYMRTDGMHGRRRGLVYIKSEWQLYKLKTDLKFQSKFQAFTLFFVRSTVRLLPTSLLEKFYKLLRK